MDDARAATRARLRTARRSLDRSRQRGAAEELARRLLELPELSGPGRLATYLPVGGEIDPNRELARLEDRGWLVHLPVVGPDASMRFVPWSPDEPLGTNRFGVPEPLRRSVELPGDQLDLALVPCVAVDPDGNRLGHGAGFYDRAFGPSVRLPSWNARRTVLVGVAHDLQVVSSIPCEEHDVPVDVVVTDERVIRPPR